MRLKNIGKYALIPALLLFITLSGCDDKSGTGAIINGGTEETSELNGYIKDISGNPIEGVVVSDGYTCTETDSKGYYSLDRNPNASHVFYSIPADCKVDIDGDSGLPLFYNKLLKSQKRYDFSLTKQAKETKFRMLALGDPQVTTANQVARFNTETIKDIKTYIAAKNVTENIPTYAITLGDIVGDKWDLYPNMVSAMSHSNTGIPVFQTIGNHDHEFPNVSDITAQRSFESYFGPLNYSFNRGDVHFISMDDVIHGATVSDDYVGGFLDWQYEWLKQDLSYVPKDKHVVLCVHIPFKGAFTVEGGGYYFEVLALLAEFKEARIFAGHTHYNDMGYNHTSGTKKVREHILGTTCGAWWHGIICADGSPNGYGVYEFDGTELKNGIYKPTNFDEKFQLRLYNASDKFDGGGATGYQFAVKGANQIIANIWGMNDTWRTEVYENGVLSTNKLQRVTSIEAWARAFFYGYEKVTASAYGNSTSNHIFYYNKLDTAASVRVVVYDEFGNVFEQSEITSPTYYPKSY